MSLSEQLTAIREGAKAKIPADKLVVMHKATDDLRASGIMQRTVKVGDKFPPFELNNARGALVASRDLFGLGAVVLTIFRGH